MFEPGSLVGDRYRLRERLGSGGMAEVWRAEDRRLERDVAIKVLREPDEALAHRLRRESRVLAGLTHPAVVAVYDAGEVEGRPYLVLELVRGETLAALLQRAGRLDPERVAELGAQLADGLAHAHALGVAHRDVKPSNILVDEEGRARLVDFGIARSDDGTRLTGTGLSIGTAAYLAPEQLEAPDQVGPAADVYSLGLVLAEMLTGRRCFPGPAPAAALSRLRIDPPLADVPEEWSSLLAVMTRRDPTARPGAAAVAPAVRERGAVPTGAASAAAITEAFTATADAGAALADSTAAFPVTAALEPAAVAASFARMPDDPAGPGRAPRRRLWLATAGVLAILGVGIGLTLASRAGDGGGSRGDQPVPTVASTAVVAAPVATLPPTTVAPTTSVPVTLVTTTTAPPRHEPKPPKPHGHGHGYD